MDQTTFRLIKDIVVEVIDAYDRRTWLRTTSKVFETLLCHRGGTADVRATASDAASIAGKWVKENA